MAIRQILVLKFMTKLHYDFPKILNLSLCSMKCMFSINLNNLYVRIISTIIKNYRIYHDEILDFYLILHIEMTNKYLFIRVLHTTNPLFTSSSTKS